MNLKSIPGIALNETTGLLDIDNAFCKARMALQGAQVLQFQAQGQPPLLWLSERAVFAPGKAVRGGIPLCFPWFGPHPENTALPAHGFARTRHWQLIRAEATEEGHVLGLRLEADAASKELWPYEFVADLEILFGQELRLTLLVRNCDTRPFTFTCAMHSYFPVRDIAEARVYGLEATPYIDQLLAHAVQPAAGAAICFSEETDRIYTGASGNYQIEDGATRIDIRAENCHSAVAWNPWQAKAARLADMAPESWRHMLCVETGNVAGDLVALAPGEHSRMSMTLSAHLSISTE